MFLLLKRSLRTSQKSRSCRGSASARFFFTRLVPSRREGTRRVKNLSGRRRRPCSQLKVTLETVGAIDPCRNRCQVKRPGSVTPSFPSGLAQERQRSFTALRMTKSLAVILSFLSLATSEALTRRGVVNFKLQRRISPPLRQAQE